MANVISTTVPDVQKVVEALKHQHGEFSLAMLYKEDGLSETGWNLIVASPWADRLGRAEATRAVTRALSEGLNLENKQAISRITILPTKDRFVAEITARYQVASPGAGQWIQNASAAGIPIGTAFIFYSRAD